MKPDLNNLMKELIQNISKRNMYRGNKIPDSIMRQFVIEETDKNIGILVPTWISVLQYGRGPWRGTNIGNPKLRVLIYNWMKKHNLFKSKTENGKQGEAFVIARKINKEGNEQFRNHVYVDIYDTERDKTIKKIDEQFSIMISKITMEVI